MMKRRPLESAFKGKIAWGNNMEPDQPADMRSNYPRTYSSSGMELKKPEWVIAVGSDHSDNVLMLDMFLRTAITTRRLPFVK